ncbi:MAG: hypothetical protein IPL61_36955 [Myxococcales bacterium]|nr:hypothetical protein [Myxococcales bacterium]
MKLVAVVVVLACACGGSAKKTAPPSADQPVVEAEPAPVADPPAVEPEPAVPAAPPVEPTTEDDAFEAMMRQALTMFRGMGAAVDASGDDCDKLADNIQRVMDDNRDFLAQAKLYKDDKAMDQRAEAWMKEHMSEVMEPIMKVGSAAQRCASNAKFVAVMKRLDELD